VDPMTRPKRGLPFLFMMVIVGCLATTTVFLMPAIRKPAPAQPSAGATPTPIRGGGLDQAPPPGTADFQLRGAGRPPVTVRLELAPDPASRTRGLAGRTSVPPNTGMVFLYPVDTTGGFWMKDTLVPLSIAFVAANGQVVSVREMTPCRADPCQVYEPGAPYRYAVELPAGAFAAAGVGPGSQVVPLQPQQLPQAS
jgi:uncharacterized protein